MKLSSKTGFLAKKYGIHKAVDLLIDAGFDAIDFSFQNDNYELFPAEKKFYIELKKYTEEKGVYFNQAHAPAPSSFIEESESKKRFDIITSAMQRASYLGVKNIVVHPCQHMNYVEKDSSEKLFEYNMKFYRRLIPYCMIPHTRGNICLPVCQKK